MKLSVSISDEMERALKERARSAGMSEEMLAGYLLEHSLRVMPDLMTISGDTYEAFKKSGMTEDELSDLLEEEKHAMRAEKRKKAS